jgi:NADH dehydrogenase FAD-containing subunit
VTVVEMLPELSPNMESSAREAMLHRLYADGVRALTATRVTDLRESGESSLFMRGVASPMESVLEVHTVNAEGAEGVIPCDTAIAAIGLTPDTSEAAMYTELGVPTVTIGDAASSRNIRSCFEEAWAAAFGL